MTDCYLNMNNNKENKKKFTKTFDLSQIAEDPMDVYLETQGLWKKRIARDGSCLFRAVAEQIYPCQIFHTQVREECIKYMTTNKQDYEKHVSIPFDQYLNSMKDPLEYGGQLEIHAMSKLYKRDFTIYQQPNNGGIDVTQNGFKDKILVCYSFNNHFDAIFTKEYRDHLALIQSLVYEILYDKVYGSSEQVDVARRLLRKSDTIYPKEYMNSSKDSDSLLDEYDDDFNIDIDENNNNNTGENEYSEITKNKDVNDESQKYNGQKMPLPYKVAKSLDPVIYRNTAFDAWLAAKKDDLTHKIGNIAPGDKCLLRVTSDCRAHWVIGLVISINNTSATIYLHEINQNYTVTLDNIKPFNSEILNSNNVHNVQKLVQPINAEFAQIYSYSTNRKSKKKAFQMKITKSVSCHAISNGLETLPEENEEDEFLPHYYMNPFYLNEYTPLVHSQSLYSGFNENISLSSANNNNNKRMNQGNNKNRRPKYLNQNSHITINAPFQNRPLENDPFIVPSIFVPPPPPLYGSSNLPGPQPFQGSHFQPSPFMMPQPCDSFYYTSLPPNTPLLEKSIDQQQYEQKRYESYFSSKPPSNMNAYQQVPQQTQSQPSGSHMNQNLNNTSLLMPAPNLTTAPLLPPATYNATNTSGHMPRSYSCHGAISTAAYDQNQSNNNGHVYLDYYIPSQNGNFTGNGAPLIVPPNQTMLINNNNASNLTSIPSFATNCLENNSGYDFQFPRIDSNHNLTSLGNIGMIDDQLLNNDMNRNFMWSKDKINKNESFADQMYINQPQQPPPPPQANINNQQYCYPNCVLININGQVNYNALYSYSDDDLNLQDISTLRFFYNLGIEHHRLCLVNNSNYTQSNYSNNYIPNTINHQPITMINTQQQQQQGSVDSIMINNMNKSNSVNQDIDKLNKSTIVDINNNNGHTLISNQLVPNMNGKGAHLNQPYNNQPRRIN